jgi:hypothetical protein
MNQKRKVKPINTVKAAHTVKASAILKILTCQRRMKEDNITQGEQFYSISYKSITCSNIIV